MKNAHLTNLLIALGLLLIVGIACKSSGRADKGHASSEPVTAVKRQENSKLDEYTIKGFRFVYFRIPSDLDRQTLVETAQRLHDSEPNAQLLLLDDDTNLKDYIAYAKAAGGEGNVEKTDLPKEWADKHIVANVQKYVNGKFVLCEGNGYKEISDLE